MQLHALLYGDQSVTLSTLKAEVSHLRSALGGELASRPYRLPIPVRTDVDRVLGLIRRGHVAAAVDAYGGDLLPGTNSPALTQLGDFVAVAVRESLMADPQPSAVMRYTALAPYDTEVVEVALAALGDRPHPARALLLARLATTGVDQPFANLGRLVSEVTALTPPRGAPLTRISVEVDGANYTDDVEPRMLLVHYLRERLGKTGTVVGCDTSNCGACTVHLDGRSVKSCNVLAVQADGQRGHHRRGARPGRRAAPDADGVPRVPRPPVRLLHPGDDHAVDRPAQRQPQPLRGGDPRRARGQPVPVHRLPQHRQGRADRVRPGASRRRLEGSAS